MSEFNSPFEHPDNTVAFTFNSGDKVNDGLAREIFKDSGIAEWVQERVLRHGDYIEPRIMYVNDFGGADEHHVAWVYRKGFRKKEGVDDKEKEHYTVHHIVCDCVACTSRDERVESIYNCDDVKNVIMRRAIDVGNEFRTQKIMPELHELDIESLEFKPTIQAQEFIKGTVGYLLETDYLHPEQWMANMRSGVLLISTVAQIVHEKKSRVLPVLDELHHEGIVEFDNVVIKLGSSALNNPD